MCETFGLTSKFSKSKSKFQIRKWLLFYYKNVPNIAWGILTLNILIFWNSKLPGCPVLYLANLDLGHIRHDVCVRAKLL